MKGKYIDCPQIFIKNFKMLFFILKYYHYSSKAEKIQGGQKM